MPRLGGGRAGASRGWSVLDRRSQSTHAGLQGPYTETRLCLLRRAERRPRGTRFGIRRAEAATYQLSRAYATTANVMRPGRTPRPIRMNWFIGPKPPPALLAALRLYNSLTKKGRSFQ